MVEWKFEARTPPPLGARWPSDGRGDARSRRADHPGLADRPERRRRTARVRGPLHAGRSRRSRGSHRGGRDGTAPRLGRPVNGMGRPPGPTYYVGVTPVGSGARHPSLGLILPPTTQGELGSSTGATSSSTAGGTGSAPDLVELCRRAEATGADSLWAVDHLFWPHPMGESLTTLAVAAVATSRPTLGTCVLQLPLRRPAAVPDFCLLLAQAPCPRSCDHPYTPRPVRHHGDRVSWRRALPSGCISLRCLVPEGARGAA